jgi:HAD superfamily hydrolase (TIGR01509 family)
MTADGAIARYTGISMPCVMQKIEAEFLRALPPDFLGRLRTADEAAFRQELRAIDGAAAAARALALPKCVASSGRLAKMRLTLGLTGLLPLFEPHLFSAEMVARGKPSPDLFLYAADRMGVVPARCVVIEDSVAGVRAGVAAGMQVLGFSGGGHCPPGHDIALREAGASSVFAQMKELPGLLDDAVAAQRSGSSGNGRCSPSPV